MMGGSVTSVGVKYSDGLGTTGLAAHTAALLCGLFEREAAGGWRLRFVGGGPAEAFVEIVVDPANDRARGEARLEQALLLPWAEISVGVALEGVGVLRGVLRADAARPGFLLDLADADLFPSDHGPLPLDRVETALKDLLLRWHELLPFERAFADHEAELDDDEGGSRPSWEGRYALSAWPHAAADSESPLTFGGGGWRISPLGG